MIYDIISPEESKLLFDIHKKYQKFFEMAVKLLKASYDIFPAENIIIIDETTAKSNIHPHVERALLALYTQSFRLFRSVLILCKAGLDVEVNIQLRSLLEVTTYLLYIAEKDHKQRFDHYIHSRALSEWVAVNDLVSVSPGFRSKLNMELV